MVNSVPYQLNKRETKFIECPSRFLLPVKTPKLTVITNATLTSDPVKSNEDFTVVGSATLLKSVTKDASFVVEFYDSNNNPISGGGFTGNLCNPQCPTNYYQIDFTTRAPPHLPSNYSIVLAFVGNQVPHRIVTACGFASGLSG
ncbi:13554_t:CDS:1 [Dentiscutata heterogama]|uniref:13554_t:CDS:1 n=1 Tax=Dentiscutata heterogama TaxID=1316150 RepID=A0ACA9MNG1_9GLOM|nr:13554_t:CDS:1 [Dentiscutata heterogama]